MKSILNFFANKVLGTLFVATCSISCLENSDISPVTSTTLEFQLGKNSLNGLKRPPLIDLSDFRSIASSLFSSNLVQSEQAIVKYQSNYIYFNFERLIRSESRRLNSYFGFQNFDFQQFARQIDLGNNGLGYSGQSILASQVPGAINYFSSEQIRLLDSFVSRMYEATDALSATMYYRIFINSVNENASLSNDQRITLLAIAEVGNEFAKNFFAGKFMGVNYEIEEETGVSVSACSVNWRSVWAAGVVGGVVGAVFGAKTGAAGGTVAFPGLGTATGAVGGGVIGFATGFIGGVGTGIATELLTSCFRAPKQPQNMVLYCKSLPSYLRTPLDQCSTELYDHKLIFSLRDLMG